MTRRILFLSCPFAALAAAATTFAWNWPGTAMGLRAEPATSQASPKDESAGLDPLKAKLREQRGKIKSLYVEYRFETEALIDPKILPRWQMLEIHPYRAEEHVGFRDRQRYLRRILPDGLSFITPPDQVEPDPAAPAFLKSIINRRKQDAARIADRQPELRAEDKTTIYTGEALLSTIHPDSREVYLKNPTPPRVYSPRMYLSCAGLRPPDPAPNKDVRAMEREDWIPDAFDRFDAVRVLEETEVVDGAQCLIVEGRKAVPGPERELQQVERFWFDPARGLALLRREVRYDGVLSERRSCSRLEEVASGIWLPREATWERCGPNWAAAEYRGKPAFAYRITAIKIRVNDAANDKLFGPGPDAQVFERPRTEQ
jgi:hypothetical protein